MDISQTKTNEIAEIMSEKIEADKEILSTMPKNNAKNIKKCLEKISELKKEYEKYQDDILKTFEKRYKKATEIEISKDIENLNIRLNTIEKVLPLLNDQKTSYEKMGLDKIIFKIDRYYKGNLDDINEQIEEAIKKFESVGIKLELSDFKYSTYVNQYMKVFFQEMKKGDANSSKMKEKFEEVYWKCSDIIVHIELNIRNIYLKNQPQIDKYFEKKRNDLLKQWDKTLSEIMKSYLELKSQKQEAIAHDKKQLLDSFLSGKFNVKDFEPAQMEKNYSKILAPSIIENIETNQVEIEKSVVEFLNSLYEYKNYMKFKFIIDDVKKYYKEKDNYKNAYKDNKKNVDAIEKQLKKLNKKLSHQGLFAKKEKEVKQSAEQKQMTADLKKAYKDLDLNKFYNKVSTNLEDNSTVYDVLKLASSYYNYLIKCMIENNSKITQEQMDTMVHELDEFLKSPCINIVNNLTILDENDVAIIIKDRYRLLNFNIEKEDFSLKNINNLIAVLEIIEKDFGLNRAGLKVGDVEEIVELKDVLKL